MEFINIRRLFYASSPPRFNFGVWKPKLGETYLLGREVKNKSKSYYEPDIGNLIFVKLKGSKVVSKKVVWKVEGDCLLEDPRAMQLSSEKILLGLTAVLRIKSRWTPYPAVASFSNSTLQMGTVKVIQNFGPGKNTTPLKRNIMLFRPAGREFYHKFLVFSLKNNKAAKCCELPVPVVSWCRWKMGSSAPPIWLTRNKALLFLAGINIVDHKYTYSIGRAILEMKGKSFKISHIDTDPLITRETFSRFEVEELHPEDRKVVYLCGTAKGTNGTIDLYVNVGDRSTFVVTAKLTDLTSV